MDHREHLEEILRCAARHIPERWDVCLRVGDEFYWWELDSPTCGIICSNDLPNFDDSSSLAEQLLVLVNEARSHKAEELKIEFVPLTLDEFLGKE